MNIILLPEVLKQKLGDDGAKEFVNLLNESVKAAKESTSDVLAERFEKRLAETESKIIRWMFGFWVGQITVTIALISLLYKLAT
ncbi:MAG: hypothetical protein RJR37_00940 [Peptococcaceae bacterium MAG4]|nr:hypothetical protein [Peptococcaceae bacterium MAG4]